jgi:uncharacterized protein with HEPN domain
MSLRRPELALNDLIEAADHIASFVGQVDEERFMADAMIRSAVYAQLVIIGEAARAVPDEIRAGHPDVPWRQMVALRNEVLHRYFTVDWDIVWTIAQNNVPEMRRRVMQILRSDHPLVAKAIEETSTGTNFTGADLSSAILGDAAQPPAELEHGPEPMPTDGDVAGGSPPTT